MEDNSEKIWSLFLIYIIQYLKTRKDNNLVIKGVFRGALKDFFKKKINESELEALSSILYYKFSKPEIVDKKDKKLGSILDIASDITYYKKDEKRYKMIIDQLEKYHKLILKN